MNNIVPEVPTNKTDTWGTFRFESRSRENRLKKAQHKWLCEHFFKRFSREIGQIWKFVDITGIANIARFIFLSFCLTCLISTSQATVLNNLYQANVSVQTQSSTEREKCIPNALREVLIKVSGNTSIATLPIIQEALNRANQFVQQFSYHQINTQSDTKLFLRITFASDAIVKLLQKARQGIWGNERPLIIAWLVLQDKDSLHFIANDSESATAEAIQQYANQRGLMITLPMLDLEDLMQISTDDVLHNKLDKIKSVSTRYQGTAIVAGQIIHNKTRWQANWQLLFQGETLTWELQGDTLTHVIKTSIDNIADALATKLAVLDDTDQKKHIYMSIKNIKTVADYTKIISYLNNLAPVTDVQIVSVAPEEVRYNITLLSNVQSLIQAIALNPLLTPANNTTLQQSEYLRYQLAS